MFLFITHTGKLLTEFWLMTVDSECHIHVTAGVKQEM